MKQKKSYDKIRLKTKIIKANMIKKKIKVFKLNLAYNLTQHQVLIKF